MHNFYKCSIIILGDKMRLDCLINELLESIDFGLLNLYSEVLKEDIDN